ncbi:NADAR family protein [Niabella yanshanensis]|uniref:NADAR family protein n=1 Tax=Niabella yanshanensis TaxID=577386 RepID=A0ABZ0W2E6_9BACT|nr:NADAR family protein [Niabella yanshanensis]WQD36808.1 NADAR family protein [Niabella yanshanensis]
MMAQKTVLFANGDLFNKIIDSHTPAEAKALGRQIIGFDELIWNDHKYNIVTTGNIHKFNQHPQLAAYLANTGDSILVEASPVDRIWGIGLAQDDPYIDNIYAWQGQNLLGFALMEVRDFLKDFGTFQPLENASEPP